MSVAMVANITIGNYVFKYVNSYEVKRSWKTIIQTATIKLPNINGLIEAIKVGDNVTIQSGYDELMFTEFVGYVSEITPNIPVEIKCECGMWKLKQENVSKAWRTTSLQEVVTFLVPDVQTECPAITLAPFRLDKVSKAKALQKLKDEYMLTVYFRLDKLFVGLAYTEKNLPTVNYLFRTEGANANIDGLTFKNANDTKLKVKAISLLPNNKQLKKEYGDEDGNTTTLHYYNKTEAELDVLAKEQIQRLKYDGYKGTFKTKALPYIDHGYTANIKDAKYPDKQQSVFVDAVTVTYGPDGYNRLIEAGRRASQ